MRHYVPKKWRERPPERKPDYRATDKSSERPAATRKTKHRRFSKHDEAKVAVARTLKPLKREPKWVEIPDPGSDTAPNPELIYTKPKGTPDVSSRTKRAPGFGWRLPTGPAAREVALAHRKRENEKAEREEQIRQQWRMEDKVRKTIARYARSGQRGIWASIMKRARGAAMLVARGVITLEQLPDTWWEFMYPSERERFPELAQALDQAAFVLKRKTA